VILKFIHDKLLQDYDFMLSVVGSGRKSLSHASHKDKVFDDLVKHAKKIRANLVVTESFIFFSLCYRHCTASRLASKQNAIVLVEDLRINVTYDCLVLVAMQDRVSRD
jgi:hypothetical protein